MTMALPKPTKPPHPYLPEYKDENFFLDNHVTLSYLGPNQGYGAFASHDIPRHTLILAEEPLLECDHVDRARHLHESDTHKCQHDDDIFLERICRLDQARRRLLWHMHDQYQSDSIAGEGENEDDVEEKRLWGIIRSNAYHNSDHDYRPALYFAAAKLNHSCRPNVGYDFNNWTMRMYTTRDVTKGEELLSCYSDVVYHEVGSVRIRYLNRRLGFTCVCEACCSISSSVSLPKERKIISTVESDRRRKHLRDLAISITESLGVTFLYDEEFAREVKRETRIAQIENEEEDCHYDTEDTYAHESSYSSFDGGKRRGNSNSMSGKVRPRTPDLDTLLEYIHLLEEEGIDHDVLDCYELAFDLAVFLEERSYMKSYNLGSKCLELYEITKGPKHKKTKKFRSKLRKAEYAGLT